MDKYRPETKQAKKERLRERAAARAEGKEDAPTKRFVSEFDVLIVPWC